MRSWGAGRLLGVALLAATLGSVIAAEAPAGFTVLFNGRDLSGWRVEGDAASHWQVRDGVIDYDGKGKDLWSEREYGDFTLKVDWRLMTPNGDSGIYLRGSSKSQINIWCDPLGSGEIYGYRTDTSMPEEVRKGVTPLKRADRPVGEWNSFTITMRGDRVTVDLNGERVIENARLPGVKPRGAIALQNHGNPLQFRSIFIQELPAQPAAR
jgi:hypothetical protein